MAMAKRGSSKRTGSANGATKIVPAVDASNGAETAQTVAPLNDAETVPAVDASNGAETVPAVDASNGAETAQTVFGQIVRDNLTATVSRPWEIGQLLAREELQPEGFPHRNPSAFMTQVRILMGPDGMLPEPGKEQEAERLKVAFTTANLSLVEALLGEYNSWYSPTTQRLLPKAVRGRVIGATSAVRLPWAGTWATTKMLTRVTDPNAVLLSGPVPVPSMLAWEETLRGLNEAQVAEIKRLKASEAADLGKVAKEIAAILVQAEDRVVSTRFGVIEVSCLEKVATCTLSNGGVGIQISRMARVRDGKIHLGSILDLTPMSRILSFYEMNFVGAEIEPPAQGVIDASVL